MQHEDRGGLYGFSFLCITCTEGKGGETMNKNVGKEVLQLVKRKLGKSISEQEISHLAQYLKPSMFENDASMRKLIKQVSTLAGIPVNESTTREIIEAIRKSGANPQQLEQMMRMMLRK